MKTTVLHLLRGAALAGAATFVADLASGAPSLGLEPTTTALVATILGAVATWLTAEADHSG